MKRGTQTVMAFDFGTKKIGIAIGQEITNSSQTFYTVKANEGEPEWTQLDKVGFERGFVPRAAAPRVGLNKARTK